MAPTATSNEKPGESPSPAPEKKARTGPSLANRIIAPFRNAWRILTQMRTALILLMMLAIAAIPGALLPQRNLSQQNVDQYLAERPTLGKVFDAVQLFDVFSSWWFTAIYALLFISLIGCLTPRSFELVRQLKTEPPKAPSRFTRLPHNAKVTTDLAPDEVEDVIRDNLKGWRVRYSDGDGRVKGAKEFSAERGYLREIGNIVFHFGMLALLIAMALGKFFYYEGMVIQIPGRDAPAFCNTTPAAFDSFRAGLRVDGTELSPFCVRVDNFSADYLPNGQAKMFSADIRHNDEVEASDPNTWATHHLKVNDPLRINGDRVYLQGHGYAPTFTVTWPNGETRTDTYQWAPTDQMTFLSSGVMRFDPPAGMYPDFGERVENGIAIQGLFAPTAAFEGELLSSSFPAMNDPAVAVDVYVGDTGLETGRMPGVFSLDQTLIDDGLLNREARVNLAPGESTTLPNGVEVRFDGAQEFANLQVSHDPAQIYVGISAVVMMGGLILSISVRRRRFWARITTDDDGRTVLTLGGLARTDRAGWGKEFDRMRQSILDSLGKTTKEGV
ncbi:cytochrome c biogenesis protein ResB [Dietzia timorensis]|uniref:Cytochrome c biogenesis protein CcsB n=1 Tax=Dietzia timorensis TaxID=499555 RepID=A0A173LP29_9ACTN|nr:Cytochrome c biogenesis protein CcsB [Dietzia timorensis]